jgi:hypothetical protein
MCALVPLPTPRRHGSAGPARATGVVAAVTAPSSSSRYGAKCAYCGRDLFVTYEDWLDLSVDHVVPRNAKDVDVPSEWIEVPWHGDRRQHPHLQPWRPVVCRRHDRPGTHRDIELGATMFLPAHRVQRPELPIRAPPSRTERSHRTSPG